MIKCDYVGLALQTSYLNSYYNNIVFSITEISSALEKLSEIANWNTKTSEYFSGLSDDLKENLAILVSKIQNASEYLDVVIGNYQTADQNLWK